MIHPLKIARAVQRGFLHYIEVVDQNEESVLFVPISNSRNPPTDDQTAKAKAAAERIVRNLNQAAGYAGMEDVAGPKDIIHGHAVVHIAEHDRAAFAKSIEQIKSRVAFLMQRPNPDAVEVNCNNRINDVIRRLNGDGEPYTCIEMLHDRITKIEDTLFAMRRALEPE